MDVKLYFHAPDQFLDLFGRMGYKLYRGEVMQTQITIRDSNELEKESADDKNYFAFGKTANKSCTKDLYDDCVYNMLSRDMRENTEDGCTVPYVKDADNICTKEKDILMTSEIVRNIIKHGAHSCNVPCHSVAVDLGAKNYQNLTIARQPFAVLELYLLPTAIQTTEKLLYTRFRLLAEIGGYIGLLCGYSLFSFLRWINGRFERKIKQLEGSSEYKLE